jgi:polysaccharide export outer membrane protein
MQLHRRAGSIVIGIILASLAAVGSSAAVAQTSGQAPAMPSDSSQGYHIASGDVLSIAVWGQEQFSQECEVNGAGTISYPLLGDIEAAGRTCLELQCELEEGLGQYLRRPRAMVKVVGYGTAGTSVFVLGEVRRPGVYPVASRMGLLQALAAAGGATDLASGEVTIAKARTGEIHTIGLETAVVGSPSRTEALIEPGDVIVLNRQPDADRQRRYAVLGEVPHPGMYDMPADGEVSVLDAMEEAGLLGRDAGADAGAATGMTDAPNSVADLEHAMLTRGEIVVPLNLSALLHGDTSQNVLLQEGDVLTIPRLSLIGVYALGEVRTPGRQTLPSDATLMNLLNAVGGVTSAAHLPDATILRTVEGQPRPIEVDLGALLHRADPEHNVALQEGDVLFVPTKGGKRSDILRFLPIIPYLLN